MPTELDDRPHVGYERISDDRTGTGDGVSSQEIEVDEDAEDRGMPITQHYADNDTSAFAENRRRADYERMMTRVDQGGIASITAWHANRLHRRSEEVNQFIKRCRRQRVRVVTVMHGEYDLEKAAGRKALRDDTSDAEYESEHRGERVAIARKRQARRGEWGGGPRPYGWGVDTGRVRSVCVNPKAPTMDRVYEDRPVLDMTRHNPREAAEIRRWADDVLVGVPLEQLVTDLAARAVLTVSQAQGRTPKRNGREVEHQGWNSRTIVQILTHPRTSGHSVYNGEIIKRNAFEPIIPEDTRQALIALFADPKRKTSPGNTPKWLGSLIYQCAKCDDGTTMTVRRNKQGTPVYQCQKRSHCQWPAKEVNNAVTDVIVERLSRRDAADLMTPAVEVDLPALREQVRALEARKADASRRYGRLEYDAEEYAEIRDAANAALAEIRAEIDNAVSHSPLAAFAAADDVRATWEGLSLGRQREIVRYLLEVKLPPPGRGVRHFDRSKIQIRRAKRATPPPAPRTLAA